MVIVTLTGVVVMGAGDVGSGAGRADGAGPPAPRGRVVSAGRGGHNLHCPGCLSVYSCSM